MEIPDGKLSRGSVLSKTISFLRFPLIFLVVIGHSPVKEFVLGGALENFPVADVFCNITKGGIARIAVPLFFFISGYLFFLNVSSFSREFYFGKLKRRFWTLFVPLAVWGIPVFIAKCIAWKFSPELFQSLNLNYTSVTEFAQGLFTLGILGHAIGPFWFIRGLIIAFILSPLWFFLLKKLKVLPLIIFGLWYCFLPFPTGVPEMICPFGAVVVFFFCFGAYFSIHEIDFTKVFRKIRIPFFIAYPILLVGDAVLRFLGYTELYGKIEYFETIIGLVAAIALVSGFLEKRPTLSVPKTLRDATFFVFAGHTLVFPFVPKIVSFFPNLLPCETSTGIILAFIVVTVFTVGGCVILSILVRKFAPWSIRFLTGGR